MLSRRELLKRGGALIVSFGASSLVERLAGAQQGQSPGAFDTHNSHVDPKKLDSWLAVGADGTVTAHTGKCDFGQGMLTAQTQLVAEELCVPVSSVRLIECDTAVTPDQGTTSGSQSTPTNFNEANLALAAATAREALLQMAGQRWNERPETLAISDGVIEGRSGRVTYAELIGGKHFSLTINVSAKRRPQHEWKVLGKPVPSLDRPALMTGRFEFVQAVRVPGMLHGRVVRPPGMGATLAGVDRASVAHIAGTRVVVRKDFVGVVANTQFDAEAAVRALKVRWNPGPELPEQATFYDHMRRQPAQDSVSVDSGDVDGALAGARVIQARYRYPYQMHGSVGPSCAVADVKGKKATVWSSTHSVYPTRSIIAKLLDLPVDDVHVIFVRGSGCYGLNGADAVSFDAAMLSASVGRPVRLQYSRGDEMRWENLGAACVVEHRAVLGADGRIAAWDRESWAASRGNRPGYDKPGNVISGALVGFEPEMPKPGTPPKPPQKFENRGNPVPAYFAGCVGDVCAGGGKIRKERVRTHTVASPFFTGPLRSPLRIQNTFANECFMDELCAEAQADPLEFRLKHLDDARLIGVIQAAAKAAGWERRPMKQPGSARSNVQRGRGIACVNYEGGNGYAALVADIEVDGITGVVRPTRFVLAIDCGPASNPDGLRNQCEGGLLQGLSRSLGEEVTWDAQHITSVDWQSYHSLYLDYEVPAIETVIVQPAGAKATGAGETAITLVPCALGNAIWDATGVRLRQIPFTGERVKTAIEGPR